MPLESLTVRLMFAIRTVYRILHNQRRYSAGMVVRCTAAVLAAEVGPSPFAVAAAVVELAHCIAVVAEALAVGLAELER